MLWCPLPLRRRHSRRSERGGRAMRPRLGSATSILATSATADPSRWTHRVEVTGLTCRKTPPPDAPNELAHQSSCLFVGWCKKSALTRGASSSPLFRDERIALVAGGGEA